MGDIVEPGHHYEWFWPLRQVPRLTGGESVDNYTSALYKHADTQGWDGEGLIVDELGSASNVITASRRSWPLTEAAKANIAEGAHARGTFDEKAAHCFTSLAGRFLARPEAGWIGSPRRASRSPTSCRRARFITSSVRSPRHRA
jgi:mannose/cellobiose epimerase-like protein (N-acyl-D-glucosamine 2-epimerase family)